MLRRYTNGLGIVALATVMAVTPLVPAAVSAAPPIWVWDADGNVHDATGQYVRVENDQTPQSVKYPVIELGDADSSGGGCR